MKKKYKPEIDRTLVLSTAHISKKLSKTITRACLIVHKYEYGWYILVPKSMRTWTPIDPWIKVILKPLLALCRKHKCKWLRLDRDADTNPNLKTYDW